MKRLIRNKHARLIAKHIAGWFCIVVGIIMCITPGQGLLSILLGIYLLADEVPLFGRIRDGLERRFPKATTFVNRQKQKLHNRFQKEKPGTPAKDE
ncbi:hypothetical protein EGM51_09690 [Verrucomicrobia bacterium S94]|nr:hypothetical protein EGM51_09690 [Verrucomicrobia bacterium S94]